MVNSRKSVFTKAAAIAMSITMLTSALSFGVNASAADLESTATVASSGPVVSCPIEDGVLYITIEGGQWKHWIEYASGEATSGYGTLDIKTINGVETFIYSDTDGNVILQWDEEAPSNSGGRGDITDGEEEENEEETGAVDLKIAEKLLNMLYAEQSALSEEAGYFNDMYKELKSSISEATTIKSVLRNTMSNDELADITEYIKAANKQKTYAYNQYKRFNSAATRCGNEIRLIEKRLGKSNSVVDVSGGEGTSSKSAGTGGLSFWKSSAYQNAASNGYGDATDKIVTFSDDEKLFLKAINEYKQSYSTKVYAVITVRSKTETYYLKYFPKDKAVYRVTVKGTKLSNTPEYSSADIAKGLLKNYKFAYDKLKQILNYDYAVYTAATSFYEEKGKLLNEKYNAIKDYKTEHKKDFSVAERETVDAIINTLGGSGTHHYRVMAVKTGKIYQSGPISLYKYAAKEVEKTAKSMGVTLTSTATSGDTANG